MSHRLVLLAVAILLTAGCASNNPDPIATTQPSPAPENFGPPDALALRTSDYARRVEELLSRRSKPTTQEAKNGWPEPNALRLYAGNTPPALEPRTTDTAQTVTLRANPNEPVKSAVTNPPAPAQQAPPPATPTDEMETRLAKQVKDYPRDLVAQFDYQLLNLLKDNPVPQLGTVAGLPNDERELLTALIDGLANFRNAVRSDPNMLSTVKLRPINEMADRLRAQAELRVPTLLLCTNVRGFGNYDPIEPPRFTAGKDTKAVIYCEVENFSSQLNDQKLWETRLTQEAVLYTETGMQVWKDKTRPIIDVARNRRHDFYLTQMINFPATLGINRYLLKVTIVDQQANRVAEATIPIDFVAQ